MELTRSYERVIPDTVLHRFEWRETRNAAAIMHATNPVEFADVVDVLGCFILSNTRDVVPAGGNESATAAHLNERFRARGWREATYGVQVTSTLTRRAFAAAGETNPSVVEGVVDSPSYLVDNVKGRVALDVEWHAKDGNLDRDIAAYRSLYDSGIIDCAAIVTMKRLDLRAMAVRLDPTTTKYATSTTTNLEKVLPRLTRGDGGGCPILVVAISRDTAPGFDWGV